MKYILIWLAIGALLLCGSGIALAVPPCPTPQPTEQPTTEPTQAPEPTAEPTIELPTVEPTTVPTEVPTVIPTEVPPPTVGETPTPQVKLPTPVAPTATKPPSDDDDDDDDATPVPLAPPMLPSPLTLPVTGGSSVLAILGACSISFGIGWWLCSLCATSQHADHCAECELSRMTKD